MNNKEYGNAVKEIEGIFGQYSPQMHKAIFETLQKWKIETFCAVVKYIIANWEPSFGCSKPVPAHYRAAYKDLYIPIENELPKRQQETEADRAGLEVFLNHKKELIKKLGAKDGFRLRDSHFNGAFACDVCAREGCKGANVERMRNGCNGFLTQEMADLKKLKPIKEE